jgi:hypothetical protein
MAVYIYELSTEHNYPGISVYKRLKDGALNGWRIQANEGYVFYDTNDNNTEWNEELQQDVPVTYYYTIAVLPLRYNFNNFSWVAVLRDSVNENYVIGAGDVV